LLVAGDDAAAVVLLPAAEPLLFGSGGRCCVEGVFGCCLSSLELELSDIDTASVSFPLVTVGLAYRARSQSGTQASTDMARQMAVRSTAKPSHVPKAAAENRAFGVEDGAPVLELVPLGEASLSGERFWNLTISVLKTVYFVGHQRLANERYMPP
jgi:hypothetical protein